jgi:6-phosphogluconolactonase (cycloisomerase 2 family)
MTAQTNFLRRLLHSQRLVRAFALTTVWGGLIALAGCGDGTVTVPARVVQTYTVGGSISGLGNATGLVLANGSATLDVPAGATAFTLPGSFVFNQTYAVTVQALPAGVACSVANAMGTVATADVTNVVVTCSDQSFSLGGTVSGLNAAGLVLANGTDTVTLAAGDTTFKLPTPVAFTSSYAVTVQAQPIGLNCTVANGTGTMPAADVTTVAVTCAEQPFTLGGTITGLIGPGLQLANGTDVLIVPANATTFTLPTGVDFGAAYAVTIKTPAPGLTCTLMNGAGTMPAANVTNIVVTCSTQSFSLGGSVTGLTTAGLVLANGTATLAVPANATTFTFPAPVAFGSQYAVTVQTQPTGLTCTPSAATGAMPAGNVTTVVVTCAVNSYTLGGTISGLSTTGLILANGTDTVSVAANATTFSFPTGVAFGAAYNVTVSVQPQGYVCVVTNGTGTMGAGAVTSVTVACTRAVYAYLTDDVHNMILQYSVDPTTHQLSAAPVGSVASGALPLDVKVNAASTFAYAVNVSGNTISEYSIDQNTGALTAIGTVPTGGSTPLQLVINAAGTFAYVNNYSSGTIAGYHIGADGLLTAVPGSPFNPYPAAVSPNNSLNRLALNPAGTALYVTADHANLIGTVNLDATTGAMTLLTSAASAPTPFAIAVNPAGTYAYVVNRDANSVSQFSISAADHSLTFVANVATSGAQPIGITLDPQGHFLYTANNQDAAHSVTGYSIGAGGALTQVASVPTGLSASTVTVDPSGDTLYAVNNGVAANTVSLFTINPTTGALTANGNASGPTGSELNALAFGTP